MIFISFGNSTWLLLLGPIMLSDWLKVLKSSKKFKVCNQSEIQDDCTAIQRFYMGPIWENHFSQKSGIGLNPNGT
jgi:hypothetical protein